MSCWVLVPGGHAVQVLEFLLVLTVFKGHFSHASLLLEFRKEPGGQAVMQRKRGFLS